MALKHHKKLQIIARNLLEDFSSLLSSSDNLNYISDNLNYIEESRCSLSGEVWGLRVGSDVVDASRQGRRRIGEEGPRRMTSTKPNS